MQHSKAQSLYKALSEERTRTCGMREDIVDVQNGLTNYQTNVTARLDLIQHELEALKLQPEQPPWALAAAAPAPAAAPATAVETQAASQPPPAAAPAAAVGAPVASPPPAGSQHPASLDDIDMDHVMEVEGYEVYEDRSDQPDDEGTISRARIQEAFATIDALKAEELGFIEGPMAKRTKTGATDAIGEYHPADRFASFASKCSGRIRVFTGQNNRSYIDWEDHFMES